jgi:hypothetical protein
MATPGVQPPREIRPGLFHWTAVHPKIRIPVSSYWLASARLLLDPLLPPAGAGVPAAGLAWLREHGPPERVILTNRHHWRDSSEIVAAFDCPVFCNELGLHELAGVAGAAHVRGFRAGERLAGGVESHAVGVLCPDETALRIPLPDGDACLAVADGVIRDGGGGEGPLAFVPDALVADTPDAVARVKRGLRAVYRRLCGLDWRHLLLAHGHPIVGGGREALRAFCAARSRRSPG